MKVRIGRYGDHLPAHQLVVNGSVLFENTLTVNNAYYFGSSGWSMYYDSRAGGIVFVQNGTVRFTINSGGGVSRV